jgi:Fe-S-cluster containining protein
MVVESGTKNRLIEKVAEIYDWLDEQIRDSRKQAGRCNACGKCCDFDKYDHRLFVTSPELIYLIDNLGYENIKPMKKGCCPYQTAGRCSIYKYRFAGCRIFCCSGDADFQSRLSESTLEMFKQVCIDFDIPYRYADLPTTLNSVVYNQ